MAFQDSPFLRYYRQPGVENPFQGPLAAAAQYDHTNVSLSLPREINGSSEILSCYEWTASFLLEVLQTQVSNDLPKILDLGSGTAAGTLMAHRFMPTAYVDGIEQSEGMRQLARYKCNLLDSKELASCELELGGLFPEGIPKS